MSKVTPKQREILDIMKGIKKAKDEDPMKDIVAKLKDDTGQEDKNKSSSSSVSEASNTNEKNSQSEENKADDVSIISEVIDVVGKEVVSAIDKQTQIITDATVRAIALRQNTATSNDLEDLLLKALDIVVDKSTNAIIDTFALQMQQSTKKSKVKRVDLIDLYREYIRVLFISETINREQELYSENDIILLRDELKRKHLANSGFLTMPISLYQKHIATLSENNSVPGKISQGAEIYLDYLDNLAIVNIFKEDFLNIF